MTSTYPDRHRTDDENLWLEDIYGEQPLAWVSEQNQRTLGLFGPENLARTKAQALEVYDSDDRIPMVSQHGDWLYNHWQDDNHPRGLWRRTTLEIYRSGSPAWDVLLDIDALGEREGTRWVWHGAELLSPDFTRALVQLSPDGGDADEVREFDLESRTFVEDGFYVPVGKTEISWIDRDTVWLGTDFGADSLTTSGYARQVRRWQRGTSISQAEIVTTIDRQHMVARATHDHTPGFERNVLVDTIDFFHRTYDLLVDGTLVRLDIPTDATMHFHRQWLTIEVKSEWLVGGATYSAGSLLAIELDAFLAGSRVFASVFVPDSQTSLQSASWTRNHLLLNLMQDVASLVRIATPSPEGWRFEELETPSFQATVAWAVDEVDSDDYWLHSMGFLQPATLSLGTVGGDAHALKSMPPLFDAAALTVEQHFAISADGTRIPYFQVGAKDLALDSSHPTMLFGYGGFEYSLTPAYDAATGRAWLETGGIYVVANIRGGSEYGPDWHTSALRENRHRAYEDFAAVAQDLVARGVTSPAHLGCTGRSNGGLLVGNMLTHYPELFGAIVCGVPLLDMRRYTHLNAGASWIAEYGDPDVPEDWAFIQTFSPYHNLRDGVDYPPMLFYTATSDDRVGPVQARKMAARMLGREMPDVWFFENTQGGHAGSADNGERATMTALTLEFMRINLA